MNGTYFDIKEFSIHDGPGARVTVFLKGCPLRCIWCHNPEGLSAQPQVMYKENLCTHCGRCRTPCDHPECKPFGRCIHACANGCLSVAGKEISAHDLANQLRAHRDILELMGGGVTVSGGEPLMQAEFVCELFDQLDGIHKAIQTSGYADNETYRRVIEKCDFVMQDIKLADKDQHIQFTGVSNDRIFANIEYLKKSGKPFVFRVPLIPGITDTEENLMGIADIASDYPVELLKYNSLAGAKYPMVGMEYKLGERTGSAHDVTRYFKNANFG